MNKDEFAKLLYALTKALPNKAPDFKDKFVIEFWYNAFKNDNFNELKTCILQMGASCEGFPTIKKIKTLMNTGLESDDQLGDDVAARIEHSISRFGYSNPEEAKEYIGEAGWTVVSNLGGWDRVCEVRIDELASSRRQWREFAKVIIQKSRSGVLDHGPMLPEANPKIAALVTKVSGSLNALKD